MSPSRGFAQLHRAVLRPRLRLLSGAEAKVVMAVLMNMDPRTSLWITTTSEVAEESGLSRDSVGTALVKLRGRGLIDCEPGANQHARTVVNAAPLVDLVPVEPTFGHLESLSRKSTTNREKLDNQVDKHGSATSANADSKL